jgi:hypothetical protein
MFDDDDALEDELRLAAQLIDPVPPHLLHSAAGAFTWRTVDAELAELVFDSLVQEPAVVRGTGEPRLLTFQAAALTVEVEVVAEGAARRVIGRLVPASGQLARPAEVEIRFGDRLLTVTADELGRFTATGPGAGPMRLRCRAGDDPGSALVVTEWVST